MSTLLLSLIVGGCVLFTFGILWQQLCKSRAGWMKELEILSQPRKHKFPRSAILCGGSIAGTVTARILADHFERVVLVDPEIKDAERPKTRIMQYNAVHAFLSLLPVVMPADWQAHYSGVLLPSPFKDCPLGRLPDTLVMRRSGAQKVLHRLLLKHPTAANITLLAGTARGVEPSAEMTSIQSVVVRKLDGTQVSLNDVAIVADCTGSTQAGFKWLQNAGFSLPKNFAAHTAETCVMRVCVLTFLRSLKRSFQYLLHDRKGAVYRIQHFKYGDSLVALVKTDNNTMQLLLGDCGNTDLPRMLLTLETISILCEKGNPQFDNIKIPTLSHVQYHLAPAGALPSNFVAIGDANLKLNPIYGQGFAKILLNSLALNALLHTTNPSGQKLPRDFSARFFKKNAGNTQSLWRAICLLIFSAWVDLSFQGFYETARLRNRGLRANGGRNEGYWSICALDDEVASALWHVRHLLAGDRMFLAPTLLWKIL
ncbi:hypothetical protein C8R44DRAFT_887182 [Mycena epipterygia]|nr:hypothetical protein C8R44DRAFT_887182 [Mycena epipterygia]